MVVSRDGRWALLFPNSNHDVAEVIRSSCSVKKNCVSTPIRCVSIPLLNEKTPSSYIQAPPCPVHSLPPSPCLAPVAVGDVYMIILNSVVLLTAESARRSAYILTIRRPCQRHSVPILSNDLPSSNKSPASPGRNECGVM